MNNGYCASRIKCNSCGYEWVGVWPDAADQNKLECPKCHEQNSGIRRAEVTHD